MLFDTDVLIWFFRGSAKAARWIEESTERCLSIINYLELLQGARNRREMIEIKNFIRDFSFVNYPMTENISHRAAVYMEEFSPVSKFGVADSLIAATATEYGIPLLTGNTRHYRIIPDLHIREFKP